MERNTNDHAGRRNEAFTSNDSLNLRELRQLARKYAQGAYCVDLRQVRVIVGPCPECGDYGGHVHTPEISSKSQLVRQKMAGKLYRSLIVIERYNLFMPRRLQEWLIAHEVAHLHSPPPKRHNSPEFIAIERRLVKDPNTRLNEYYRYLQVNRKQLGALVRKMSPNCNLAAA